MRSIRLQDTSSWTGTRCGTLGTGIVRLAIVFFFFFSTNGETGTYLVVENPLLLVGHGFATTHVSHKVDHVLLSLQVVRMGCLERINDLELT